MTITDAELLALLRQGTSFDPVTSRLAEAGPADADELVIRFLRQILHDQEEAGQCGS